MPTEAEAGKVLWKAGWRAHMEVEKRLRTKAGTQESFGVERTVAGLRKLKCTTQEIACKVV